MASRHGVHCLGQLCDMLALPKVLKPGTGAEVKVNWTRLYTEMEA